MSPILTRYHVGNPSLKWLPLSKDIFGLNKVFVLTAVNENQTFPPIKVRDYRKTPSCRPTPTGEA